MKHTTQPETETLPPTAEEFDNFLRKLDIAKGYDPDEIDEEEETEQEEEE